MAKAEPESLYKPAEACKMAEVAPYVLRYWETEFPQIKPDKGGSKQRLYKQKDVDTILQIKQMLYKDGFTIAGARKRLNNRGGQENIGAVLETAKKELREILEILK